MQSLRPRSWVCSSCSRLLRRTSPIDRQRRWLSVGSKAGAAEAAARPHIPVDNAATGQQHDDALLRQMFDSPRVWKDYVKRARLQSTGLFENAYLTHPEGFLVFARLSLKKARTIVDKVLNASTLEEYRAIVKLLDRLSDILCRVLDTADFIRGAHPDRAMQRMASEAWEMVYEYMNELNTTAGLNDQLGKAMGNPEVTKTWSEEEMTVARVLKSDFDKSAINLPKSYRDRFVELSSEISRVGSVFMNEMTPEQRFVVLPSSQFKGMDPVEARNLARRGMIYLPTWSHYTAMALRSVHDENARKHVFYASRTASAKSVELLEYLMGLRGELARLSGFESYAQMTLRDRMMARTPESVRQFLGALTISNGPMMKQEMADLLDEKKKTVPDATSLQPWDKDFYSESIRRSMKAAQRHDDFLSAYFSLGTVIQGLSRIFTRLYGIRFVPRETLPGETWHPDVRRLDVVSDTDGHVAVLYCDLFYRPGKSPNPAHFTVRCSREISEGEVAEAATAQSEGYGDLPNFESPELAANDGMSLSKKNGVLKQLPTVVLVCDFPQNASAGTRPALLSFYQLETLFHEMGHAIHSVLARTSFQNVSGTRCATDLAELPSTLMEYFAADPSVLSLFARHYETDEPLPYELVAERLRLSRRFEASDTEHQIILAMLDQELHSSQAVGQELNSTEIYHGLQHKFGLAPPDPPGTRWQGFFGHLSSYGSTYYSYLFDRVLAQRVWKVVFSAGQDGGAVRRENGEQLKEQLLRWGGSRDPWKCLSGALQDNRLADGGETAMALVGSWGTNSLGRDIKQR
ncbi:mitochondrial intermediate peptidase [Diplogelasinospora grovesii]|uniref:Mitochondrial intermediate peptidase n=1 Tax=Diplogelasinospora grovesii TaxID=303347 RepID=A0AAN6S6D5_9PEZI|nr:mitochondrial intermediate peptidase [Diplogelasinospora grovesii]